MLQGLLQPGILGLTLATAIEASGWSGDGR